MKRISLLLSLTFALFLVGSAMGGNLDYTTDIKSGAIFPTVHKTNPSPVIDQYDYDLALTNIGIEAIPDDCMEFCETWEFWVKAHNAGYEIVDCALILFTINGEVIGEVHVAGLYPSEVRKYLVSFHVDWQQCEPFIIDAHVDWPLDENPANDDIEDEFAVGGEPDEILQIDDGTVVNGWTWLPGYEYPDYGQAAKYHFETAGTVKFMQLYYSCSSGYPSGHCEFFVWAADGNGDIIDDGTGGIMNMEFQYPRIIWPAYGSICYPVCLPVQPSDTYYFGCSNRQGLIAYTCIDGSSTNPSQNWYKSAGIWYEGDIGYNGDYFIRVGVEYGDYVSMTCENLTPIFCRGKNIYFLHTIDNNTAGPVTGVMTFTGYAGFDCDPANALRALGRSKTYPVGVTPTYYFFKVPNAVGPGPYSVSISGTLAGSDLFCCMNTTCIECGPWRSGNTEWELAEVERPEVDLPTFTSLDQNYPNPFNATTNISFSLVEAGNVSLNVYDITGRLVVTLVDGQMDAGQHVVVWDASSVSSGVYFYKLATVDYSATKSMNLLK